MACGRPDFAFSFGVKKTFAVPMGVRRAALDGLRLYRSGHQNKITDAAVERAKCLARGVRVDLELVWYMRNWFARHAVDERPGWDARVTPGWVAYQIWGGDAARRWVRRLSARYRLSTRRRFRV